jgi:hypothetical protein
MSTTNAFLTAVGITVAIAAGFGAYNAKEFFINHDTEFRNLGITGAVRVRPETSWNSGYSMYNNNVGSYYNYGSELRFYDNYQLNGRALGKIFN